MAGKKGAKSGVKGHPPYPGCETGGAPVTKYTPEFISKVNLELIEWMKKKENIFIEDFCEDRDFSDSRFREMLEKNEKLSATYEKFKAKQRVALYKGGLSKKFSFPMCNLILGHCHGIYTKTEQKITTEGDPLPSWVTEATGISKDLVNEC